MLVSVSDKSRHGYGVPPGTHEDSSPQYDNYKDAKVYT